MSATTALFPRNFISGVSRRHERCKHDFVPRSLLCDTSTTLLGARWRSYCCAVRGVTNSASQTGGRPDGTALFPLNFVSDVSRRHGRRKHDFVLRSLLCDTSTTLLSSRWRRYFCSTLFRAFHGVTSGANMTLFRAHYFVTRALLCWARDGGVIAALCEA